MYLRLLGQLLRSVESLLQAIVGQLHSQEREMATGIYGAMRLHLDSFHAGIAVRLAD
jgi:hypothetical protein